MHAGAVEHHVAGKCDEPLGVLEQKRHAARTIAFRLDTPDRVTAPCEVVHFVESKIHPHWMDRWADVARAVNGEPVAQRRLHLPPCKWSFEKRTLDFRNGDLR